jgi:hypothetical protein
VDLWKSRLTPGVSRPISELGKRLDDLTRRSRLPPLLAQLRRLFPHAVHDNHRLEEFFHLFPERFTVHRGEMDVRVLMGHTAFRSLSAPLSPYSPEQGWRELGVTPLMLEYLGSVLGRSVYTFVNDTKISEYIPDGTSTGSALVYNVWGDHAFFYRRGIGMAAGKTSMRALTDPPTVRLSIPREEVLEVSWTSTCKCRAAIPLYFHWVQARRPDLEGFRRYLDSRGIKEPPELERLFLAEVVSCNGHFSLSDDLEDLSKELLALRIGHRRVYGSPRDIRSLVLTPSVRAKIRVDRTPVEAPQLNNYSRKLSEHSSFDVP